MVSVAEFLIGFFNGLAGEWVVFIMAMIPVIELRGALPIGLTYYHLPLLSAYVFSVLGNILPVVFILLYIGPVSDWLTKNSRLMAKFFDWLFKRTRHKMRRKYEQYGLLALTIFVMVPLPMTGAWTGALAAWLFGMETKKAFISILIGVITAGVIVLLATTGLVGFLKFLI